MNDLAFRFRNSSSSQAARLVVCCVVAMCLLLLELSAHAQPWKPIRPLVDPADNLSNTWMINANGWPGELVINQDFLGGRVQGTMYGERVVGYFASIERTMVLVRYSAASLTPSQAFVGTVSRDGKTWSGRFYGLDMAWSGASEAQNAWAFTATRMTATFPPAPPAVMPSAPGAPYLGSLYTIYNRPQEYGTTWPGALNFLLGSFIDPNQGQIDGTVFGDSFMGTYAHHTGTIAFVRLQRGQPVQVFVGRADGGYGYSFAPTLGGDFYPLTEAMGADPSRLTYDWRTGILGCEGSIC